MNDNVISLGLQLENVELELSSLVGKLVKMHEEYDEDDILGGCQPIGFGIDIWNSFEFLCEVSFKQENPPDVIETLEIGVVCIVTNTFCNKSSDRGGALEVITPSGTCGWVSVYDVIIAT